MSLQEREEASAASTSSASSAAAEVLRAGSRLSVVCPIEQHLIMDHSYASSLPKWRHVDEEFLDAAHEVGGAAAATGQTEREHWWWPDCFSL